MKKEYERNIQDINDKEEVVIEILSIDNHLNDEGLSKKLFARLNLRIGDVYLNKGVFYRKDKAGKDVPPFLSTSFKHKAGDKYYYDFLIKAEEDEKFWRTDAAMKILERALVGVALRSTGLKNFAWYLQAMYKEAQLNSKEYGDNGCEDCIHSNWEEAIEEDDKKITREKNRNTCPVVNEFVDDDKIQKEYEEETYQSDIYFNPDSDTLDDDKKRAKFVSKKLRNKASREDFGQGCPYKTKSFYSKKSQRMVTMPGLPAPMDVYGQVVITEDDYTRIVLDASLLLEAGVYRSIFTERKDINNIEDYMELIALDLGELSSPTPGDSGQEEEVEVEVEADLEEDLAELDDNEKLIKLYEIIEENNLSKKEADQLVAKYA